MFGWGDPASVSTIMRGVVRFGQLTVKAHGRCQELNYPAEEQAWVVTAGSGRLHYGGETSPAKARDFLYIPATIRHSISNDSDTPVQLFIMGFKIEPNTAPPAHLMIANIDEIKKQSLSSHPGRHPAKPGDAYFFRENCTVGFYNSSDGPAHILAVRAVFPRPANPQYVK